MIIEESTGNRVSGIFRGIVLKHLPHGRCKIFIPGVYDYTYQNNPDLLPSAQPKTPLFAGTNNGNGCFSYPNLSSIVWCEFLNGDVNFPVFDSATLGGENAFGQYELIKTKDEEVSERHLITSGKTHMMWYECGKLSGIVVDPIRTNCSVEYDQFEKEDNNTSVENKYSYEITNPVNEKISKNQLSNINCQYVLDNDAGVHGELSTSTHWYDLININLSDEQLTCKGTISTDNRNIMNNTGLIDIGTISSYSAFTTDDKNKFTDNSKYKIDNQIKLEVPGYYIQKVKNYKNIDYKSNSAKQLTKKQIKNSEICTEQDITEDSYEYIVSAHIDDIQNINDITNKQTINLTSNVDSSFSMSHPGMNSQLMTIDETVISSDENTSKKYTKILNSTADIEQDTDSNTYICTVKNLKLTDQTAGKGIITSTELTNIYEMSEEGSIEVSTTKKEQTTKNITADEVLLINSFSKNNLDITGKNISQAKNYKLHNISGTEILVDNNSTIGMENGTDAKLTFKVSGKKSVSKSPVIDCKYDNLINMSTSTANIQIIDNVAKKECINNMNAKSGKTEIKISNKVSKMNCTIILDAEGKMTISTTDCLDITTTNTVNIKTTQTNVVSPTVNIKGNTTIDGTLLVTGATTVLPDATIGGKSFLGHIHIGNMGAATSPPV